MSSEWLLTPLSDVITVKHGYAFKGEHFADEPTPYQLTTPGNFAIGGGFQVGKGKYYSGPVPNDYVLSKGDLIVTMTDLSKAADTLGFSAVVPETAGTTWLHNQRVGLVSVKPDVPVHPEFLHYLLRSREYRHWVVSSATGSTVKHTSPGRICTYQFALPPISVQTGIGAVLTALDDRITLLRETSATLEAIAQALFKSWFVDFDPVRAKAEGLEPQAMDSTTAALFPDSFEESELGVVPTGWRVGSILDIANLLSGGTPKTDRAEYWGGDIPWASAKDVSQAANSILTCTDRTITDLGLQKSSTKMIPAYSTVVVARGATTGRMVMFGKSMAMNQTCYALESKVGTPIALYLVLKKEIDALTQKAHGSVFDTITTSTFSASKTLLIPNTLLRCFESVAGPLFHRMLAGTQKAETLTQLRDTLLPRLISGQLRLPGAEEMLENAL